MNLELRKRIMKCLVWSVVLYAADILTLTQTDRRLEAFEMWIWRRMEKISCKFSNEEVLGRVNKERQTLNFIWIGLVLRHDRVEIIEGRVRDKPTRWRRRIQMLHDLANDGVFVHSNRQLRTERYETQRKDVKNLLYRRRLLMI